MAAVAGAHIVGDALGFFQGAAGFQVGQDGFAGFQGGHAGVLAAVQHVGFVGSSAAGSLFSVHSGFIGSAGHMAVVRQHADHGQVMALAHFKVVGVVGGGDLHHAGAFFHIGVFVADNGNLTVQQRQDHMAAMQVGIARVLGVDGYSRIAQHGFGAGGGQFQGLAGFLYLIKQMPEAAFLGLVLYLGVRDGGVAVGAPVDHAVAAVDQALVVQADEHFLDSVGAAFIHGEAFPFPVAGATQLFQLADDTVAVGVFPVPGALQKAVAAYHLFGQAFFPHFGHNFRLGGNGSVVGTGHPKGGVSLHPLVTGQDILPGFVHGVAHVQLAGNVRRRHHNGEGLFAAVDLGMEIPFVAPVLVDAVFSTLGCVLFGKFFRHKQTSCFVLRGSLQRKKAAP